MACISLKTEEEGKRAQRCAFAPGFVARRGRWLFGVWDFRYKIVALDGQSGVALARVAWRFSSSRVVPQWYVSRDSDLYEACAPIVGGTCAQRETVLPGMIWISGCGWQVPGAAEVYLL